MGYGGNYRFFSSDLNQRSVKNLIKNNAKNTPDSSKLQPAKSGDHLGLTKSNLYKESGICDT